MKTEAITNASLAMLSPMQSRPPCYLSKVHQLFTIVVLIRHSYWFPSLLGITCCSSLRLYLVRVSVTEKRNQLESKAVHITGYSRTVFETVSFLSIFCTSTPFPSLSLPRLTAPFSPPACPLTRRLTLMARQNPTRALP